MHTKAFLQPHIIYFLTKNEKWTKLKYLCLKTDI